MKSLNPPILWRYCCLVWLASPLGCNSPISQIHPPKNPDIFEIAPDQVVYYENISIQNNREIEDLGANIRRLEAELRDAKYNFAQLSLTVTTYQSTKSTQLVNIRLAKDELNAAKKKFADFIAATGQLEVAIKENAVALVGIEYQKEVQEIENARRKRNETRTRLGALPDYGSEAQLALIKKRSAQLKADQLYSEIVSRDLAKISTIAKDLKTNVTTIQDKLFVLLDQLYIGCENISKVEEKMSSYENIVSTFPAKICTMQERRNELLAKNDSLREPLQIARTKLDQINLQLASLKAGNANSPQINPRYESSIPVQSSYPQANYYPATTYTNYSPPQYNYNSTYSPSPGIERVNGYTRKDGTIVEGDYRTRRDDSVRNNFSTKGNTNPFTGQKGTRKVSN